MLILPPRENHKQLGPYLFAVCMQISEFTQLYPTNVFHSIHVDSIPGFLKPCLITAFQHVSSVLESGP